MSKGNTISERIPVLLLKTKSSPVDEYERYFSRDKEYSFEPSFVPVLQHTIKEDAVKFLRESLPFRTSAESAQIDQAESEYGGVIFTSQRSVEALGHVVSQIRAVTGCEDKRLPADFHLYVVGPATARALTALNLGAPILGEETGNGDALAAFILEHYNSQQSRPLDSSQWTKKPLLFLVGEKRRDIIPKTLQSPDLHAESRIVVHEKEVYETTESTSFAEDIGTLLKSNFSRRVPMQWVVVFSPAGCKAMLKAIAEIDPVYRKIGEQREDDRARKSSRRHIFVATIGPTTRTYLVDNFGVEPDVCSEKPNPQSLGDGIRNYLKGNTVV